LQELTEQQLRWWTQAHNRQQLWRAMFLASMAFATWVFSYVFTVLFVLLITILLFRSWPSATLMHGVSIGVMGLLLFEAWRYKGKLFDWEKYQVSTWYCAGRIVPRDAITYAFARLPQAGFGIANIMLCAPRLSIKAYQHWRARLPTDNAVSATYCL
jgi:hypothetical protein